MAHRLIGAGILAGALGGFFAFSFGRYFAQPFIEKAVEYESAREHAQDRLDGAGLIAHAHDEIFSRAVQADVGFAVALILAGSALGALYSLVYILAISRVSPRRPRQLAVVLSGLGFAAVYFVPFVKYPANPPGVGSAETIQQRTALYLLMLLASIAFMVLAVAAGRLLGRRFGTWTATVAACVFYLSVIGAVMAILPPVGDLDTEIPLPLKNSAGTIVFPGFPADTLWGFRFYSVLAQALLWATIGLVFAPIADRVLNGRRKNPPPRPILGGHP